MARRSRAAVLLPLLLLATDMVSAKVSQTSSLISQSTHWGEPGTSSSPADTGGSTETNSGETGCRHCHVREELKKMQIDVIKAQILQKLGMEQAPNMTGRLLPNVSDDLIRMYMQRQRSEDQQSEQQYMADEDDDDHSQPEKMWTFASRSPLAEGYGVLSNDPLGSEVMYFDLSESITEMDLEQAILWLYIKRTRHRKSHNKNHTIQLTINKVVYQDGSVILKEAMKEEIRLHHKKGSRTSAGYHRINVKKLVQDWFRYPNENYGITIHTRDDRGRRGYSVNSFDDEVGDASGKLPILEVNVSSERRRMKRTAGGNFCTDNSTETNCCRFPLVVDFHEFGWDWIIAPSSYRANYCSGNCPYVYLQKYPHTHIVQQYGGTSGPCCGPRKLSPIHMLYWDTFNHIRFDKLPNMIVDSCGCH